MGGEIRLKPFPLYIAIGELKMNSRSVNGMQQKPLKIISFLSSSTPGMGKDKPSNSRGSDPKQSDNG